MLEADGLPYVDFVIVADRAEAVNGKLYMMGGGWDRLSVADFAQPVQFHIALGVVVPWTATNNQHPVQVELQNEDGATLEPRLEVGILVGRPPEAIPGQSFRAIVTVAASFLLPRPGAYALIATIGSGEGRRAVFHAVQTSPPPTTPPR